MSRSKYGPVPAEDAHAAIQSFEVEDALAGRNDQSMRRKLAIVFTCIFVLSVGFGLHWIYEGNKSSARHSTNASRTFDGERESEPPNPSAEDGDLGLDHVENEGNASTTIQSSPQTIFCYGDSLTYGMVPNSRKESYPYSKYLELELNSTLASESSYGSQTQSSAILVDHLGLPGWTALSMLNHMNDNEVGICSILHRIPVISELSLLIILAGTNDVGQITNAGKAVARSIVESIVNLHKGALKCAKDKSNVKFQTLAVGIPGSAFQDSVRVASELVAYINNALKQFAASFPGGEVSYVDFPFPYKEGDPKWSEDGIHLTQRGYEAFGKELAQHVKAILDNINT
ncbi:hypothetical protein ACHAWF_015935 [Thalassiosira exigua]